MSKHLSDAVLRRYVDEPDALLSYEAEHVQNCERCSATFNQVHENARVAAEALALEEPALDLAAARASVEQRSHVAPLASVPPMAQGGVFATRMRWAIPVAAALVVGLLFTYAPFRAYAQNLLTIFEPRKIQAVPITAADFRELHGAPQLNQLGIVKTSGKSEPQRFSSLDAAQRYAHLSLEHPAYLPAAVASTASYQVIAPATVSFTFDAQKARESAARNHMSIPSPPPGVDGATIRTVAGPFIVATYGGQSERSRQFPHNGVIVMQAPVPALQASRGDVRQIESYLLSLPNVPEDFKTEVRAIEDPEATLPIPFPVDRSNAKRITIHGSPAILYGDNTGVGSAVLWVGNGRFYQVSGGFTADEVTKIADSLER